MTDCVLRASDVVKQYRKPFTNRRVDAVLGVSFEVRRGEIFGFLGPNGAGKTTTIKMLTGLVAATRGRMEILGVPAPAPEAIFAELTAGVLKKKSAATGASESIKEGNKVLFELSAREGRYGIRLGKQVDKRLRKELQRDLKEWLHAWLKARSPEAPK